MHMCLFTQNEVHQHTVFAVMLSSSSIRIRAAFVAFVGAF